MPKVMLQISEVPSEVELRESFAALLSEEEFMRFMKEILDLVSTGDLGFWLSPQLVRKVKVFGSKEQGEAGKGSGEVNGTQFLSWLLKGGTMQLRIDWRVEDLPSNSGIYRILLEGGSHGKSINDNQG